ncbi:hypothetical protein AX16_006294 [Volvariella volvacea WC 439]|nr:hypothetical protein AX16_006294 [Volvariella volvacea WC 439]
MTVLMFMCGYDLVNTLNSKNATATFFVNGCIYETEQVNRVRYAYNHGHQLASHTWSHGHLNTMNWDQLHDEFWRVEEALMKITGAYPAFVRPPYGEYNDLVREVARVRGQDIVIWDFDSGDSVGVPPAESIQRYLNVTVAHPSTILPLNHDPIATTVHEVIPTAIDILQAAGYRLVSLSECLGLPAYQWVEEPFPRDDSWHC